MAKLFISEYNRMLVDFKVGHPTPVPMEPPLVEQTVAIGGTSAQSAAFNANTKFIRVHADVVCSRLLGANPVATLDNARMAAGATEYVGVEPGDKIAVIANT